MAAAAVLVIGVFLATHSLEVVARLDAVKQWLLLLALAVLCMFLPTLCQAEGIRRLGAQRGSMASTIGPPAAMLLGAALLGRATWCVADHGHGADPRGHRGHRAALTHQLPTRADVARSAGEQDGLGVLDGRGRSVNDQHIALPHHQVARGFTPGDARADAPR